MGDKTQKAQQQRMREEHDEVLSVFMARPERERLLILRSWKFWEEAVGAAATVWKKIEEDGLETVTDDDMARLFLVEARRVGQRPSVRARALGEIGKMRVQRLREELQRLRREARKDLGSLQEKYRLAKRAKKSAVEAMEVMQRDQEKLIEKAVQEDRNRRQEVAGRLG